MSVVLECGCGNRFEALRRSRFARCPDCAARAKLIKQARWREKNKAKLRELVAAPAPEALIGLDMAPVKAAIERGVVNLVVVRDPLEVGGFRSGLKLNKDDWRMMLTHSTFTPGTILSDGRGRLYVFDGEKR